MLKTLALLLAYTKAPKATLVARHPNKALAAYAVTEGLRRSRLARRSVGGLIGLGAAAVALPLIGYKLLRH